MSGGHAPLLCRSDRTIGIPISFARLFDRCSTSSISRSCEIRSTRIIDAQPVSIHAGKFASREGADTTHFAVVDAAGNAVAVTVTLNSHYGSGVTVPGLGFMLNNNMDNFAADPGKTNQYGLIQGEANAIQPGNGPYPR